jgi:hypothetical protein
MIVHYFDILGVSRHPPKTDAPLVVNSCVSQGDSRTDALANIREAIELYVEDCREADDPVPTEVGKEFVEVEAASGQ